MNKFTNRIDMKFQYTCAAATDIRKTIARELRRLADEKAKAEAAEAEQGRKVRKLKEVKA